MRAAGRWPLGIERLVCNVWPVLNPWLVFANGVAWLWRRLGLEWTPPLAYPERLGVWPGAFLLLCFAALEPLGEREGRLVLRTPFSGLGGVERTPGMLAFVAVMLGSVGFDGLSRAPLWQDLRADLEAPYIVDAPRTAELHATGLALAGILACVLAVALAYLAATAIAERMVRADRPLRADFLRSLVPIALVYAVAHYFTLLLVQGQYAWPLASDPFGYGWDLLGSVDYTPNIAPLSPNTVWYVQVGALVAGHVAGLAVAHDRAVSALPERDALRSQYAMLGLMVLYTVGGLWLLSRG